MANEICNKLDQIEGKEKKHLDDGCKYILFPQNKTACCLSEVYSVKKGEDCYIYETTE